MLLSNIGQCSIYRLAQKLKRNCSNVYRDVKSLEGLGLITRTADDLICMPFKTLDIKFSRSCAVNEEQDDNVLQTLG